MASDGSDESDRVVGLTGLLARALGAQATLLHVISAESRVRPHHVQTQQQTLQRMLPGSSEALIELGSARLRIVEQARDRGASLVVMGTRRQHGPRMLGSVSARVVHEAPCSVLLVPPRAPDADRR